MLHYFRARTNTKLNLSFVCLFSFCIIAYTLCIYTQTYTIMVAFDRANSVKAGQEYLCNKYTFHTFIANNLEVRRKKWAYLRQKFYFWEFFFFLFSVQITVFKFTVYVSRKTVLCTHASHMLTTILGLMISSLQTCVY